MYKRQGLSKVALTLSQSGEIKAKYSDPLFTKCFGDILDVDQILIACKTVRKNGKCLWRIVFRELNGTGKQQSPRILERYFFSFHRYINVRRREMFLDLFQKIEFELQVDGLFCDYIQRHVVFYLWPCLQNQKLQQCLHGYISLIVRVLVCLLYTSRCV